ncbi:phosphoribosylanthranilate isomerase [Chloroflexi bacterium TSY]|nr:phosphoribosylanthranilate isomerase [Chloroflexi bacterium TSY]
MNTPYVKICGITNWVDAMVAIEAGADLLGFNFFPKSPRYVEPEQVATIIHDIREKVDTDKKMLVRTPKFVGIFVNESGTNISKVLAQTKIDYVQLHGDEKPADVAMFPTRAFKALRPSSPAAARSEAAAYASVGRRSVSDGRPGWLLDAYDPNEYGGTGKRADWHVAAELARLYSGLLLAGGLTPDNVADAIHTVLPWGVDVSSGVEESAGKKDHNKVREFIRGAKSCLDN